MEEKQEQLQPDKPSEFKISESYKVKTSNLEDDLGVLLSTNLSRVRVHLSGTQSVAKNSDVKVQLDTEDFDTNTEFDSTTNYRFTAKKVGYYSVSAAVFFNAPETTNVDYNLYIYKNGVSVSRGNNNSNSSTSIGVSITDVIYLDGVDDYLEMYVRHNASTSLNLSEYSDRTFMAISKLN